MGNSAQTRFLLAGLALSALIVAALLWLASFRTAYSHFLPNTHETCGEPVVLRAEGYNLLGGTRYGTEPGDLGDDVELALIDICNPVVQVLPGGEERLWFWLEVAATGQTFEYYAWGVPERDLHNPNANEWRDPVDPLWGYSAFEITNYATSPGYWTTGRGELCPLNQDDLPGITLFVDSEYGFRIPVGRTRAAWVCVRMGQGEPLPETVLLSIRPQLARITRWVDKTIPIHGEQPVNTPRPAISRGYLLPLLHTNTNVCEHAMDTHPESILAGRGCPRTAQ